MMSKMGGQFGSGEGGKQPFAYNGRPSIRLVRGRTAVSRGGVQKKSGSTYSLISLDKEVGKNRKKTRAGVYHHRGPSGRNALKARIDPFLERRVDTSKPSSARYSKRERRIGNYTERGGVCSSERTFQV